MKKSRIIVSLAMVLALAISGIAYAAWTDQLFINGSAQTGNMNVVFDRGCFNFYPHTEDACYVEAEASFIDDHHITFTIDNLYPGAWALIDLKQMNKGTIPAKFDKATLTIDSDPGNIQGYLRSKCLYTLWKNPGLSLGYLQGGLFSYGNFTDLDNCITNGLHGKVINPGGYLLFGEENEEDGTEPNCIVIKLDENAPVSTEGQTLTFTLTFDWIQFNS